jgi:MarR family 2-MHQ and catechol resistance regulon transcriptional repressor
MHPENQATRRQRTALKVYTQMMRAADAVTARMHRHLADTGLTLSQFGVLEVLYHKGSLCQRDIGQKILKTSGNMTTVIDNLEKRGLVIRQQDPADRRRVAVKLTRPGYDLIQTIFPTHAAVAEETFAVLDADELAALGTLLKKVGKTNVEAANADPGRIS